MTDNPDIKPQEAKSPIANANQEQQDSPPVLRPELHIPQTVIDEYRSGQQEKDSREWRKFCVEVLTLIAIVCYTSIAAVQSCQMRRATEAAQRSADAAVRSNEITIGANIIDQRAWIGPIEAIRPTAQQLEQGGAFIFGASLHNSGKTPALKLRSTVSRRSLRRNEKFEAVYDARPNDPESISVIFPGGFGAVTAPEVQMSREVVTALKDRIIIFYLYGKIEYQDVSSTTTRHTTFCFWLKPDFSGMSACDTYNTAD